MVKDSIEYRIRFFTLFRMKQHSIFEIMTEVDSSFDRLRMNDGIKLKTNGNKADSGCQPDDITA